MPRKKKEIIEEEDITLQEDVSEELTEEAEEVQPVEILDNFIEKEKEAPIAGNEEKEYRVVGIINNSVFLTRTENGITQGITILKSNNLVKPGDLIKF
jgi:hypothetical protein